jgi:pimeloyl-ACP methyl ester carboxylesterase
MADWTSWERVERGPADAEHTVLLLPGGMCTATFYEELTAEPALAGVRLVAVTLPGHGGTPLPADPTFDHYGRMAAECAADLGAAAVVGHSIGANVAIEMAGSGAYRGPVVLLAPCFSRRDEARFIRVFDKLAVTGAWPYAAMIRGVATVTRNVPVTAERRAVLAEALGRNDPRSMRRGVREYLSYLDRHGEVASRLVAAGVPAWVVHGESGDGGATEEERRILAASPDVRLVTIPGPSNFTANEEPALVAGLVVEALAVRRPM